MSDYKEWITEIGRGPKGASVGALFDLDKTLIATYSALTLLQEQVKQKQLSVVDGIQQVLVGLAHSRNAVEFSEALNTSLMMLEGESEEAFAVLAESAFRKHWHAKIYPEAIELVNAHKKAGHTLIIVSSATRYQVEPVARVLGIDEILCTELEVENGCFTGETVGPPCWAEGKLTAAEAFSADHDVNLDKSFFYSDAVDDLLLLERVGNPRPLNPDQALSDLAVERNWPMARFKTRGKPQITDMIRTGLMWGSILPSAMLGAYSWLSGRSRQEAAIGTFQTFSSLGLTLAGVELNVKGEKYLWSHRPAIFVTNHQSILDGFILPHLVGEKMFVMGKKEARDLPLVGKTMEMAGYIMFDRNDPQKAREACDQAAEKILEGYSLAIAPEGTRTYTQKLAHLKKGAFHIALQTGVPVIGVVIKNATDLLPRGASFVQPGTIEIEVLKPVSTKKWKVGTLDRHVDDLHKLFLKSLGQEEDTA